MARLNRDDLQQGMQVAEDIRDKRGRVLIGTGATLEEKHLKALKIYGIDSVEIAGADGNGKKKAEEKIDPDALEEIREHVNRMFSLNTENRAHPMFKTLFLECVRRMTKSKKNNDKKMLETSGEKREKDEMLRKQILSGAAGKPPSPSDMVARTRSLASLPAVYQELMEVVNHPHSSAADVANVISSDPGLTARLLRIVNSTFYSFPGKIDTVSRAITIVGTAQLCDLALATSVMKMFGKSLEGIIDMNMFWRHCVACGIIARQIASRRRESNVESFFIMGLLHDIGRLIMYSQVPAISRVTVMEAEDKKLALYQAEREVMGFNHADVANSLLESWNLPISQREAIGYHHRPARASRFPVEAAVIHVSDFFVCSMLVGKSWDLYVPTLQVEAWDQLGLEESIVPDLMKECDSQVSDLMRIFQDV
ncbi:MAG: HDOD domain-containing protein [Candidatus Sumerlaeia bacterium]